LTQLTHTAPRILGIILARGGSKGVPRKNIRPVLGQPLIAYTICEGLRSSRITRLIVSSDDDEVRAIAQRYGAEAPFRRPADLATDTATSTAALQHAVAWAEEDEGQLYDFIVELMVTNPLKTAQDIDAVIEKLIATKAESVIAVARLDDHHPARAKKIENDRIVDFCVPETSSRRQDLEPPAYVRNGAIYAMRRDVLMELGLRFGSPDSRPYIMPPERSVNVDSETDLIVAEHYLKQRDLSHVRPKYAISLRMGAWYEDRLEHLAVPDHWPVCVYDMQGAAPLDDQGIRDALLNPIGTPRLRELAQGKSKVCIAVDDLTRSTEAYRIVPFLIEELHAANIADRQIYFVISLGTHRPFTYHDAVKKLGRQVYETYAVYSHNPYQNIIRLGKTSRGTPITVNRYFYEADLRILIGTLTPHPYAGFSGGAKGLMPGLAGFESIDANHKPINSAMQGRIGQTRGNSRRADMTEAARAIGLDFLVNTVVNQDARTAGVFAGDLEQAFEAAAEMARLVYATDAPYEADIGIFNAYPRDNFFLMSLNALNVWSIRDGKHDLVRKGGVVLIVNNCSEGLGTHGLYELYYPHHIRRDASGTFGSMIRDRHLVFYSPHISEAMIRDHYSEEVLGFRDWDACMEHIHRLVPSPQAVSVFPNGAIQFDRRALE